MSPVERVTWFAIVCVVGPAVRLAAFGEPLWIDELHTGWVVADGLEHLAERARAGNQSPLRFLLPWLTTRLAENEWLLRLPSLLAGVAVVPATFWVARRMSGTVSGGLLAALLVAVDPKFAFYSVEARGYSTVHLVTLLHLAAFLPAIKGQSSVKTRAVWIISGAGLFYLHYTTALAIVAELLAWLAVCGWSPWRDRERPPSLRVVIVDFGLLVLICAPALEHLRQVAAHRADWSNVLTPESPWRVFAWDTYVLAPLGMAFTLVVVRWWQQVEPLAWQPSWSTVTAVICWLSVPWLLAIVATHFASSQLLRYRYLISAAAALPFVAAIAFSSVTTRGWRTVFAVAIVLAGVTGNSTLVTWLRTGTWYAERTENW
ncbi:MAG TPA: hypothetical protein PLV92_26465, partial [Pirellulaceae bacterium]|nr:hypothetical protein [Pirellulaceae bacterium]